MQHRRTCVLVAASNIGNERPAVRQGSFDGQPLGYPALAEVGYACRSDATSSKWLMDIEIIDLADAPELVDTCAAWTFGMWGCQSGGSLAKNLAGFTAATKPGREAFTFVARRGGKTAGMASLRASDFKERLDLTPWLASVYVHPYHRGAGLAHALVKRVEAQAHKQGHHHLYLISEHAERLYVDLGWITFDHVTGPYGPSVLMNKALI